MGVNCDRTCNQYGKTCDASEMSKITTNDKVNAAFKEAGYTCKSNLGSRSYTGAPFSTGRSPDDCAPITSGYSAKCGGTLAYNNLFPLCYCK